MFKTAEEVRHIYKHASDEFYADDYNKAYNALPYSRDDLLLHGVSGGLTDRVVSRMVATPTHPGEHHRAGTGALVGGLLGGGLTFPLAVGAAPTRPGVAMALTGAGALGGGLLGYHLGKSRDRHMSGPHGDAIHARNMATMERLKGDPERTRRIAKAAIRKRAAEETARALQQVASEFHRERRRRDHY
jgi:hypothetical protein